MKNERAVKTPMIAIFCFVVSLSSITYGELSVESYCELVVEIGWEGVEYLGQVDGLTQKYCEDPNFFWAYCGEPNLFLAEKAVLEEGYDEMVSAVLAAHETTATECVAFLDENEEAIEEYRDNDPNVKKAFDDLEDQTNGLQERLKVPSYCLLTIANILQQSADLEEFIALAEGHSGDPNSFLEQEQAKREELDAGKVVLFESFDISVKEYLTVTAKSAQKISKYLNDHVHIKETVNLFSDNLHSLLERYETLRDGIVKESAEPTLE